MVKGGFRAGAGRPKGSGKFKQSTKVLRIPEGMVDSVREFVAHSGYQLPLYTSRVCAGFPSPADDYLEGRLDLNQHLIHNPSATFFVRVSGESMLDAGIRPNDLLVVDRSITPTDGAVAIVILEGEFTVKQLQFQKGRLSKLLPANVNYSPIDVSEKNELEVWGVVTHVIHSFSRQIP